LFVEFGFRLGTPAIVRNTFRQIAAGLQVAIPKGKASAYKEEYDTTGRYVAEYAAGSTPGAYSKRKVRYLSILGQPVGSAGTSVQVIPEVSLSEGQIKLSSGGQLETLSLRDDLVVTGAQVPIHSSNLLDLKLTSVRPAVALLAPILSMFSIVSASQPDGEKPAVDALDRARTGGATFRAILSQLEVSQQPAKKAADGKSNVDGVEVDPRIFVALSASLRSEPGAVAKAVKAAMTKPAVSSIIIDAMGAASSPDCENALSEMVNSDRADIRRHSLLALARTPKPGAKALATMNGILEKEPYDQLALFALGSYSRRFRDTGGLDKAAELGEFLVQRLVTARGPVQRLTAFRAIENSGYAGSLSAVASYVDDRDEMVRRAAILALGPIRLPKADEILASRLKPDSVKETRLAVIEAMRNREPSEKMVSAIVSTYRTSTVDVRHRVVDLFIRWLPHEPRLRVLLEGISQNDPEERVRLRAKAAL
jgi:HEAT repeat protein